MQGRWTNGLRAMHGGEPTQKKETFSGLFFEEFKERFGIQEHANGEKSRKNKILLAFIKNKELLHEAVITGNFYLFQYQSDSSCRRDGWTCRCANIPIAATPANRRWHSCACLKVRINHRWYGWGLSRYVQREEHHHRSAPEVLRTRYPSGKVIPHDCYLQKESPSGLSFVVCMFNRLHARSRLMRSIVLPRNCSLSGAWGVSAEWKDHPIQMLTMYKLPLKRAFFCQK